MIWQVHEAAPGPGDGVGRVVRRWFACIAQDSLGMVASHPGGLREWRDRAKECRRGWFDLNAACTDVALIHASWEDLRIGRGGLRGETRWIPLERAEQRWLLANGLWAEDEGGPITVLLAH